MDTMGVMTSVTVSKDSVINGASCTYTIRFDTNIPLASGDLFFITFPDQVKIPATGVTCGTGSNIAAVSCIATG